MTEEAAEIARLTTKVERLSRLNQGLEQKLRVAQKHLRDSYMGAVLSGLAAHWAWEDTKADRLASKAEELVNCILRRRKAWEEEQIQASKPAKERT